MNLNYYNDINIHYNHISMELLSLNCYLSILQTYLNSSNDPDDKCSVLSIHEFNKMKVTKIIFLHFFQFKNFRDHVASVSLRIHVLKEVQLILKKDVCN